MGCAEDFHFSDWNDGNDWSAEQELVWRSEPGASREDAHGVFKGCFKMHMESLRGASRCTWCHYVLFKGCFNCVELFGQPGLSRRDGTSLGFPPESE